MKFSIQRFTRLNLFFIVSIFVVTTMVFFSGAKLSFLNSVLILIVSGTVSNLIIGIKKDTLLLNSLSIINFCLLIFLSQLFIDLTFDGQAYHQEMMIQMANGWNPMFEFIDKTNNQSIWVNHYSKGYEVIGAVFYSFTKSITAVKFINTIFLGLSFLYPFLYFKKNNGTIKAILIALIVACNPVTLTQLMTNLIDGFLYCVTIITFFSYLLSKEERKYLVDFVFGFILLINIKFTGVVFGVALYGAIICYNLIVEKKKTSFFLKRVAFTLLIVAPFLYSPYIKNYSEKGHPFYPLMGANNIDFVDEYVPDVLKNKNKVEKLLYTNFVSIGNRGDSKLKIPFTFTLNELQKLRNGAPRVGSFGVWWGGILLVSILYYLISIIKIRQKFKFSVFEFIIAIILLLLFFNKAGWWLRYTPYFWLIPLLLILSINRYKNDKKEFKILFYLVTINAVFTLIVSLGLGYKDSELFKEKLRNLKETNYTYKVDFDAYLGNKALFKEYNIPFYESKSKTFLKPKAFNNVVIIETDIKDDK